MAAQNSNLAILFVDVIDISGTPDSASDAAPSAAAREYVSLLEKIAIEGRGHIVKTAADSAMYSFPDADSAVLAACEMHARIQQDPAAQARNIAIRAGVHFGSPFTAGVVAQRMAIIAASGQIITTGETKALLSAQQGNAIRQHVVPARAKQETITVYEILWQPDHDQTQMPGPGIQVPEPRPQVPAHSVSAAEAAGPRLRLIHAGREIVVALRIGIGRRKEHGIALKDPTASRDHALIERRNDKFVLVDRSSHGTFIRLNNGYEHKLWRSEVILRGGGVLSFGRRANEKGAELVSFWCESGDVVVMPPANASETEI